ncbi:MAG TPA: M20/M25/M40 family metallo-hydrolase [Gemmatimonadales bacterium]|jgi:hypothetical protein
MATPATPVRGVRGAEFVALLILCGAIWAGFAGAGEPRVVPATSAPTTFSAERAMADLRVIAAGPHPVGSAPHDRIRDYLVDRLRALGCGDVHIQSATGFNTLDGPIAATIANVVCRVRGTAPGPALLLTAHYDAVPRGPGAGDDAAGVAAILETLRALHSSPSLARDVIIVFSDAEEEGLLGAEAFVNLHPWAKDVGTVLNFDGRGDTGPVYMFQTSPGNAPLIAAVAAGVDDARTNSLTGEVYRHLPSDTDLSIWLDSDHEVGALNFAHVGGFTHYHTPIDDIASLDRRVVQHMGDYALGLARELGKSGQGPVRTIDAIYFNAPIIGVVRYDASLAVPIAIVEMLLVVLLIGVAARRRTLSAGGIGRGALLFIAILVVPTAGTWIAWTVIRPLHPGYGDILQGDPYNAGWYLLACAGFTAAVAIALSRRFERRTTAFELAAASLLAWGIIGTLIAFALPGASYMTAWPLLALIIGAVAWLAATRHEHRPSAVIALTAVPVLVLWPPIIVALESALTVNLLAFCALLISLVATLLILPLRLAGGLRRSLVMVSITVCVAALVVAEVTSGFTASRKDPDSLLYLHDAASGQAWWVTLDRRADQWTSTALDHPVRRAFDGWGVAPAGMQLLSHAATSTPPDSTPAGTATTAVEANGRRVHLHLPQAAPGESIELAVDTTVAVSDMTINGRVLANGRNDRYRPQYHPGANGDILRYFGVPADGLDLWFTVHAAGPVTINILSATSGLPATSSGPLPPRPATLMSKPFVPTDVTITRRTMVL